MDPDLDNQITKCLTDVFKFKCCKSSEQLDAIKTVLTEKRDVLINLRPAGGKSLCFQLPAVLNKDKVAIVFVDNNNTLEDHVGFLEDRGIEVYYFHSKVPKLKQIYLLKKLTKRQITPNFIYFNITTCVSHLYKELFYELIRVLCKNNLISMFVVDDAHCATSNTIDYNKSFSEIIAIRNKFPNVRIVALTSIGTEIINNDIQTSLGMVDTVENNGNYDWILSNIFIEVKYKDIIKNPYDDLTELISNFTRGMQNFSGIIICRKYQEVLTVANELSQRGIPVVPYHLKMKVENQKENKEKWMTGKVTMIVATHGSANGLNKKNVGCVVHWTLPLTMEQYYRDIGRAGRLGGKAISRIYFGVEDWMETQLTMMAMSPPLFSGFKNIANFCISNRCRRILYSESFGFDADPCGLGCDICDTESDHAAAFKKFQGYEQQHRLLLAPCEKLPKPIYLYGVKDTEEYWIKLVQKNSPNGRSTYLLGLVTALINNYQIANNRPLERIKAAKLWRLARSLEYILFSLHDLNEYIFKMGVLRSLIENLTKSNILSNYFLNYKYPSKEV